MTKKNIYIFKYNFSVMGLGFCDLHFKTFESGKCVESVDVNYSAVRKTEAEKFERLQTYLHGV